MASLMEDLADVLLQEDKQYQELNCSFKREDRCTGCRKCKEIGRNYCNGAGNDRCASWI